MGNIKPRNAHCVKMGTLYSLGSIFSQMSKMSGARNLPKVFQTPYVKFIAPRMLTGDHSAMYIGKVDCRAPMPMPARILAPVQSFQSRTTVSRIRDYKTQSVTVTCLLYENTSSSLAIRIHTPARTTQRIYIVILRPMTSETGVRKIMPSNWPRDCIAPHKAV